MAQGPIKKSKAAQTARKPSNGITKRGHRSIAPKKAALVQKHKITKKHSAGLIAKTERSLAEKAGHLEMLKGGKKGKSNGDEKGTGKKK